MLAMKVNVAELVISGTVHLTRAGPDLRGEGRGYHLMVIMMIMMILPERV